MKINRDRVTMLPEAVAENFTVLIEQFFALRYGVGTQGGTFCGDEFRMFDMSVLCPVAIVF
jgi:hypothetical protein